MIAVSIRIIGPNAMFYLAAAVSDFYVPWRSMVMASISILTTYSWFIIIRLHLVVWKSRSCR